MLKERKNNGIKRQQRIVEAYHYDNTVPDSRVETDLRVSFSPIEVEKNYQKQLSTCCSLRISIVFVDFVYQGRLAKLITLLIVKLKKQRYFARKVDELVRPLFSIVERLSYEVTEIALDRPGVQLNFSTIRRSLNFKNSVYNGLRYKRCFQSCNLATSFFKLFIFFVAIST